MRRRLALLVVATTCLTLVAFLVPLALLVRTVAEDRATVRATADVQGLVPVVGTADTTTIRLTVEQLTAESGRPVSVFLPDGTVLGAQEPRTAAVALAARGRSLTAELDGGREIVIAVQGRADGTGVIRTVVPRADITAGVARSWLVLAALGIVLVLLSLAVADRLARTLVRPITELSSVSHRLANAELTARAEPAGPPELREVAAALNHLAARIQVLLREEREQVADLSHRLRTPLTALRLEAESLPDPDDAARVASAVDALERAVTGLIRQARWRSDPPDAGPGGVTADAAAIVGERVAFWSVLAEDTGRTVTLDLASGPLPVGVPADELAAAVDALLGNVFAHTPEGTPFTVRLAREAADVALTVRDAGPGIPAGLIERGASRAGSTGLGLDIARRAAQASGGRLDLGAGVEGGAVVTLRLGPPRSSLTGA
ncbi:HAMP domain-containing sensor histidine kinase [Micromonospora sp. WMMD987]|jgi:signal transduction histidine kinase|uniref:sensor histidine kinase n=1 Tax=Micromonospora sp. WMMD987 TaxID=3016089 RepID=UPI00249AE7A3|nr:HAMP domain-containing sensor histidine kinase [Micromonospora sp. WMMD987]WFE97599.1 HAMP domain-containing sensor histidine kinase [Micromonospora sp. WMMD987]